MDRGGPSSTTIVGTDLGGSLPGRRLLSLFGRWRTSPATTDGADRGESLRNRRRRCGSGGSLPSHHCFLSFFRHRRARGSRWLPPRPPPMSSAMSSQRWPPGSSDTLRNHSSPPRWHPNLREG